MNLMGILGVLGDRALLFQKSVSTVLINLPENKPTSIELFFGFRLQNFLKSRDSTDTVQRKRGTNRFMPKMTTTKHLPSGGRCRTRTCDLPDVNRTL